MSGRSVEEPLFDFLAKELAKNSPDGRCEIESGSIKTTWRTSGGRSTLRVRRHAGVFTSKEDYGCIAISIQLSLMRAPRPKDNEAELQFRNRLDELRAMRVFSMWIHNIDGGLWFGKDLKLSPGTWEDQAEIVASEIRTLSGYVHFVRESLKEIWPAER